MEISPLIDELERFYGPQKTRRWRDPLHLILWENVLYLADDSKRAAAFEALKKKIGLRPERILGASSKELLDITTMGGIVPELQVQKLRRIASITRDRFEGDLRSILKKPTKEAIKDLKEFPAIGEPGAEKILLFTHTLPVLAPESNGVRVLVRLGFAQEQKSYSATYRKLGEAIRPYLPQDCDALIRAHGLLRRHGKTLCRRTDPLCPECPLKSHCRFNTENNRVVL